VGEVQVIIKALYNNDKIKNYVQVITWSTVDCASVTSHNQL